MLGSTYVLAHVFSKLDQRGEGSGNAPDLPDPPLVLFHPFVIQRFVLPNDKICQVGWYRPSLMDV